MNYSPQNEFKRYAFLPMGYEKSAVQLTALQILILYSPLRIGSKT